MRSLVSIVWIAAAMSWNSVAMGGSYYVSTAGSDANPGTLTQPFQTIQKAASVAVAGDTVYVRAGTYRETVTPARSGTQAAPITFQPYYGESVTVSGADVIPASSWILTSGSIYQMPVSWDLGEGANQVFVDGQMIMEARWPNTTLDVSHPTVAQTGSGSFVDGGAGLSTGTITDPNLPTKPAGYWTGAMIHISPFNVTYDQGAGWTWQTGTVVSSSAGQLSFTWTRWPNQSAITPGPKNPYYLMGKLSELDAAGEWFRDGTSSTLYLWTPGGDSPAQHVVEAKRRLFAFDLRNRSFIIVQGFNLFAATVNSNATSQYLVLDGLNAQYLSHYSLIPGAQPVLVGFLDSGIILNGKNNVLRHSIIAFSAGNGVAVIGDGHRVFNNLIHDVDYTPTDASPVAVDYSTQTNGFLIAWNTIYNAANMGIMHLNNHSASGRILHNEIYNYGLQTSDVGDVPTLLGRTETGARLLTTCVTTTQRISRMESIWTSGAVISSSITTWCGTYCAHLV